MVNTVPIFIYGPGRSGTKCIADALSRSTAITVYHEYRCVDVAMCGCSDYVGSKNRLDKLWEIYGSAIHYCETPIWIDVSNKISMVVEDLYNLFPTAHFIQVVREPYKVLASYLYKLCDEVYTTKGITSLFKWLKNPDRYMKPPGEKQYWWPILNLDLDRTKLLALYWNNACKRQCGVPPARHMSFALETFNTDDTCSRFVDFVRTSCDPYIYLCEKQFQSDMKRPTNVVTPYNFTLSEEEVDTALLNLDQGILKRWGYSGGKGYDVRYDKDA